MSMKYWNEVENAQIFDAKQLKLVQQVSEDVQLKKDCDALISRLEKAAYAYQWNWLGVPIIKYPEDIVLIQEAFFQFQPDAVVEVGVARGGGIVLAHSLQKLLGLSPKILGIDIKFHPHTIEALRSFVKEGVELFEADSTSFESEQKIKEFLSQTHRPFITLDSNHTHDHVLRELLIIDKCAPIGAIVLVADTVVGYSQSNVEDRPWSKEKNPLSAVLQFLSENSNWQPLQNYATRGLLSESRYGWIHKVES